MARYFFLALILFSKTCFAFEIGYPLDRSVILSNDVQVHLLNNFSKCSAELWKFNLVESLKTEKDLPAKILQASDSEAYFKVQLPENLQGFFQIHLASSCGERMLTLYRFKGSSAQLAEKVFQHFRSVHPAEELSYNWTSAVFLYALAELAKDQEPLQKEVYRNYLSQFFKQHLKKGIPEITSPDLASVSLSASVFLDSGAVDFDMNPVFEKTKSFFDTEPVNEIGALNHIGVRHRFFWFLPLTRNFVADSIWVDSLIMYALNGLKSAPYFKSEKIRNFALEQPLIFAQYLQDSSGFFKHAYYFGSHEKTPEKSYWARGNGWASVALTQFFEQNSVHKSAYGQALEKLLFAVKESLNQPVKVSSTLLQSHSAFNYPETSSTALFAFALAKATRLKALSFDGLPMAQQMAVDLGGYLMVDEKENFSVTQVSLPTDSFAYDWYYTLLIRPGKDITYGTGAFLLMLQEMQKNKIQF